MSVPFATDLHRKLRDHDLMDRAVQRAVREAVLTHARAGNPVAAWRDGQVVWVQPEEVFQILAKLPRDDAR